MLTAHDIDVLATSIAKDKLLNYQADHATGTFCRRCGHAPALADANAVLFGVFSKGNQQVQGPSSSKTAPIERKSCILL